MKNKYNWILFDFDGTLADTLKGIQVALNKTCKEFNIDKFYTYEECKNLIGGGAKRLFLRAFNLEDLTSLSNQKLYDFFMNEYYKEQVNNCEIYENVKDLLYFFKNNGCNLVVYSNKPQKILDECIEHFFSDIEFKYIVGDSFKYPPKPNLSWFNDFMKENNINKDEIIYVGDSEFDLNFAKNAGIACVILKYGYGNYKNIKENDRVKLIDNFKELKNIIYY